MDRGVNSEVQRLNVEQSEGRDIYAEIGKHYKTMYINNIIVVITLVLVDRIVCL